MSTDGAISIVGTVWRFKAAGALRLELWDKFYRLLRKLPEGFEDVDPAALQRVPVPI